MPRLATTLKMVGVGAAICIGGPLFVESIRPTDEELFSRFNPDLQKRNLETRHQRQEDFDIFVTQLKEHAKSDKSIWYALKDAEAQRKREENAQQQHREADESQKQKEAIRKELAGEQ
ncbi:hypothetical protein AJ80_07501 [Polytolypa hystricis UAMH7299]|uniref:Cytochrome b mRNA-processing protein 4 n=1 Tax=Polytolypa hystricis (strain UAMH7299) TaxID=1447883 RepID=A0A2B7XNP2_POLH7|nr:hypothetical protein AJ80_07501 [Polytolypa hystricis UAMH7299]